MQTPRIVALASPPPALGRPGFYRLKLIAPTRWAIVPKAIPLDKVDFVRAFG